LRAREWHRPLVLEVEVNASATVITRGIAGSQRARYRALQQCSGPAALAESHPGARYDRPVRILRLMAVTAYPALTFDA